MTKKFKGLTYIYFILDKSGSMKGVRDVAINGFNEWKQETLKVDGNYRLSMTLFDTEYNKLYENIDLNDVPDLTRNEYQPNGMTALFDAIGTTMNGVKVKKSDRALVVIYTDGQENSSKEYKQADIKKLIEDMQGKGNITFTFLAADPTQSRDVIANTYGVTTGNVLIPEAIVGERVHETIGRTFSHLTHSTREYTQSVTPGASSFYSAAQAQEQSRKKEFGELPNASGTDQPIVNLDKLEKFATTYVDTKTKLERMKRK